MPWQLLSQLAHTACRLSAIFGHCVVNPILILPILLSLVALISVRWGCCILLRIPVDRTRWPCRLLTVWLHRCIELRRCMWATSQFPIVRMSLRSSQKRSRSACRSQWHSCHICTSESRAERYVPSLSSSLSTAAHRMLPTRFSTTGSILRQYAYCRRCTK